MPVKLLLRVAQTRLRATTMLLRILTTGLEFPGAACDDGDDTTTNDVLGVDCHVLVKRLSRVDKPHATTTQLRMDDGSCEIPGDACDDDDAPPRTMSCRMINFAGTPIVDAVDEQELSLNVPNPTL